MKDNLSNDKQQAVYSIEQELRKSCSNLDKLTPNQKLCAVLSELPWKNGIYDYMESLLEAGASLKYVDEFGKTPLDVAMSKHIIGTVLWLVKNGAADHLSPNQKLCMLISHKDFELTRESCKVVAEKLLQEGADINYVDYYGKTPIKIAIDHGKAETALWLADNGAKITVEAKEFFDNQLANHLKCHNYSMAGKLPVFFKHLLKHGATIKNSSVSEKISGKSDNFTLDGLKFGKLVNKIDDHSSNCTIHDFAKFKYLIHKGFTYKDETLCKVNTTLKYDLFKLLGVSNSNILPPELNENIAQNISFKDCLEIIGDSSASSYGDIPLL